MKVKYISKNFQNETLQIIEKVNSIIADYQAQGYSLTLRQVYYQLVAKAVIPNEERSYKRLGNIISDGRLAGLIDWDSIEDRTRGLRGNSHWGEPGDIIRSAAYSYALDKWEGQENYVEVWVEKDALSGVVGKVCEELDINYFSCRGYVSQSEMYRAARRIKAKAERGLNPVIVHLGDHDPSGIDMSRDVCERVDFLGELYNCLTFKRIALNMNQIEEFNPPPNPTKLTDSRAGGYIKKFGYDSWELDALEPAVIEKLISDTVYEYMDIEKFHARLDKEGKDKSFLYDISDDFLEIQRNYQEIRKIIG